MNLANCVSVDDLSMLFTTTPVLHRVLTVNASRRDSFIVGLVVYSALSWLVVYHVSTDELILHATSFVGSVAIIGIRTVQLLRLRTTEDSAARQQIWSMVKFGAGRSLLLHYILSWSGRLI